MMKERRNSGQGSKQEHNGKESHNWYWAKYPKGKAGQKGVSTMQMGESTTKYGGILQVSRRKTERSGQQPIYDRQSPLVWRKIKRQLREGGYLGGSGKGKKGDFGSSVS